MTFTLFFDTETTGFPMRKGFNSYYHPSMVNYYNSSRLIEIAYIICDEEKKIIKSVNNIIKPDSFKIENSHIHGITQKHAEYEGIDIKKAIKTLEDDIKDVNTMVAHNIMFDLNILISECYRIENKDVIKMINDKNHICTMDMGKNHLNLKKSPKLTELYKTLFNEEFTQTHRALSDSEACMKCFYEMKK